MVRVIITPAVRNRMLASLGKAKRREIGGVLMAEQIEPGEFRIVDFSVDEVTGSAAHFVRSAEHHQAALADFFARTGQEYGKYNYLGEWHSHPNHAPVPSAVDVMSMEDLLHEERNIPFAILMIVKRGWWRRLHCSALMFQIDARPEIIDIFIEG